MASKRAMFLGIRKQTASRQRVMTWAMKLICSYERQLVLLCLSAVRIQIVTWDEC